MTQQIMINQNLLVLPLDNTVSLGNGIKIQEERGKKDIVPGLVVNANSELFKPNDVVYFPMFATSPIILDGKKYLVVNQQDVILISRGE